MKNNKFETGDIICGLPNIYRFANEDLLKARVMNIKDDNLMDIYIFKHKSNTHLIGHTVVVENSTKYFKLYDKANYEIKISCYDNLITTATYIKNGKVIKTTTARKHPDDAFDFFDGAEVAYNRLVDEIKPVKLVHNNVCLGIIGEPVGKTDSFGNPIHIGDIVDNIKLRSTATNGILPEKCFTEAICINENELVNIYNSHEPFNPDGVFAIIQPYTSLLKAQGNIIGTTEIRVK